MNDRFVAFAREKHIEARMTSQVIYFEWYMNHLFARYFTDPKQRIVLSDTTSLGVDLYHEEAEDALPYTVWYQGEQIAVNDPAEGPRPMYLNGEDKAINQVSFVINVPSVTISQREMVSMLSYVVEKYRTAGKTYLIRIGEKEDECSN